MEFKVSFRKIKPTEALKAHVEKKAGKFSKFVSYPIQVHVFLSLEKTYQCAEIALHAEHRDLVAVAKSKDLYDSIDMAVQKIETQLKKEREKRKGHSRAHQLARAESARLATDVPADVPHAEKRAPRD